VWDDIELQVQQPFSQPTKDDPGLPSALTRR
jgi:hypothetical protein